MPASSVRACSEVCTLQIVATPLFCSWRGHHISPSPPCCSSSFSQAPAYCRTPVSTAFSQTTPPLARHRVLSQTVRITEENTSLTLCGRVQRRGHLHSERSPITRQLLGKGRHRERHVVSGTEVIVLAGVECESQVVHRRSLKKDAFAFGAGKGGGPDLCYGGRIDEIEGGGAGRGPGEPAQPLLLRVLRPRRTLSCAAKLLCDRLELAVLGRRVGPRPVWILNVFLWPNMSQIGTEMPRCVQDRARDLPMGCTCDFICVSRSATALATCCFDYIWLASSVPLRRGQTANECGLRSGTERVAENAGSPLGRGTPSLAAMSCP